VRLQQVPLGLEPSGVMTARLRVPRAKYPSAAATLAFHRTLMGSLESLPSVRAVGLMTSAPFTPGVRRGVPLRDRAVARGSSDAPTPAVEQIVSPALFRALGVTLRAVLRGGMTWAGAGIVLGLVGAWAASRVIAGLLFDTSAADPLTFGVAAFAMAGVAALACMVPTIRATRIDPVSAFAWRLNHAR